jgi:uncharacterized protein (TIGR03089 family)
MLRSDPGRPRVTFYEDTPGPTQGERIELSAKVLTNWVSKAANALQDEWDLGPRSRVRLDLPPHWRALYWALATWSVGATAVLDSAVVHDSTVVHDSPADLLVTADPAAADLADGPVALVTLAALARSAGAPVGPDTMDEARQLATFADQFTPWDDPAGSDTALRIDRTGTAYESLVPARQWPHQVRVHTASPDLGAVLLDALGAWALDGSLVLSRGPEPAGGREARLVSEGVSAQA